MKCGKCGGKALVDRMFDQPGTLEVYCIICGNRYFLGSRRPTPTYLAISKLEREYRRVNGI